MATVEYGSPIDARPVPVAELLAAYRKRRRVYATDKIRFEGVPDMDVYNISRPFVWQGVCYLAGRVEPRDSEVSSVRFFTRENDNTYRAVEGLELPLLQDPFVTEWGDELIVGGTKISVGTDGKITSWHTAFYKGTHLGDLREFARAPEGMKDVRLLRLSHGVGVFTRPQGGAAGCGKIGYTQCDSLDEICPQRLGDARLLDCFLPSEWGGANELFTLGNGWIGVLGHISCRTGDGAEKRLHYYPMTFAYHPRSHTRTAIKIIAERNDFCQGPAKRPDLTDVLFTGGLVRRADGRAVLYTGTSDAEGQYIVIDDPFVEYASLAAVSQN